MAKYHVLASKEVKLCKENNCRAKYGSFETKKDADAFVRSLKGKKAPAKKTVAEPKLAKEVEELLTKAEEFKPAEELADDELIIFADDLVEEEELADSELRAYVDKYFADDELFLKSRDITLDKDVASAIFKQDQDVVSFRILNFYQENGKTPSKYAIRKSLPILQISGSNLTEPVEMVLTKEFVYALSQQTTDVYRAFYGLEARSGKKGKSEEIKGWFEDNPVKSVLLVLLISILILAGFAL